MAICHAAGTGISMRGNVALSNGNATRDANRPLQIKWRVEAADRRSNAVAPNAARNNSVALISSSGKLISAPILCRVVDQLLEPPPFVVAELALPQVEQGGDGALRRAAEKRAQHVLQFRSLRRIS